MYGALFMLIWCTCIRTGLMQTTSWDLVTSPPIVFGNKVQLRCTVSSGIAPCCTTLSRVWNRGSTQIINNGVTTLPSKYSETIDSANNRFSLIISNLDINDVGVAYTCTYGSTPTSNTLAQNASFELHPNSSESSSTKLDSINSMTSYKFQRNGVVTKIAPIPTISAKFGEKNLTIQSTIKNYDTWFYNITMSLNEDFVCSPKTNLEITVKAGQYSYNMVDEDVCQCFGCIGWSILGSFIGIILAVIFFCIWMWCHKGAPNSDAVEIPVNVHIEGVPPPAYDEKEKKNRLLCLCAVIWVITLINTVCPGLVGYYVCTCLGHSHWLWIICGLVTALIGIVFAYHRKYLKDETFLWGSLIVLSIFVIVGIFVFWPKTNRDKKNRPKKDENHEGKKEHGKNASSTAGEIHKN